MIKLPNSLRVPLPCAGWQRKIKTGIQAGAKYAGIGAALSMGAKGVSALVNHNKGPEMGEESQAVTFTDWGPAVFRVNTLETTADPKSKFTYSLITWLVIAALITLSI